MKTSPAWLEGLVGMIVTRAEVVHDYIQLQGTEGILSIYNDWQLSPESVGLKSLLGSRLIAAHDGPEAVVFMFDSDARLIVDLSDDAWHGPEALEIIRSGFPTVIWN